MISLSSPIFEKIQMSEEKRSRQILVRLTDSEHKELHAEAMANGRELAPREAGARPGRDSRLTCSPPMELPGAGRRRDHGSHRRAPPGSPSPPRRRRGGGHPPNAVFQGQGGRSSRPPDNAPAPCRIGIRPAPRLPARAPRHPPQLPTAEGGG